jgi:hypothetical protein
MSQAQAARLEAIASSLEEEARQLRALVKELRGASAADEEDEDAASRKCSRAAAAASAPTTTRELKTRQSTALEPPNAAHKHVLVKIGKSAEGVIVQLRCVMCKKKASTTCSGEGCGNVTICANGKRSCFIDHCNGEGPGKKKGRTRYI